MVMLYLGYDQNSIDPDQLAEAEAVLKSIRPYVRYFSSTQLINDLPNGELCVAMSWSGDYSSAQQRAEEVGLEMNLAYSVPREGTILFLDSLLIPADAPHPGNAHLFLNFLMRPEVIAAASDYVRYANANRAALPLVEADLRNDPAVYPPMEGRGNWQAGVIYEPKLERRRTRVWSRVKTDL